MARGAKASNNNSGSSNQQGVMLDAASQAQIAAQLIEGVRQLIEHDVVPRLGNLEATVNTRLDATDQVRVMLVTTAS